MPPVQHAHRKVLIEGREEIEKALQKMVDNGIIALLLSLPNGSHHLYTQGSLMVLPTPV